jgi:hypothetical protein
MRIFLTIAGLAGLLASTSAAMAADGPGNNDRNASNRNQIILIDDHRSDDWGQRNDRPWFNPQGPYGSGHNPAWNGPGYGQYPAPGWSNGGYGQWQRYQPLPTQVIRDRLRDQQFHDFNDWRFENGYYRVRAEDRYGRDVKLIVDAYNGRIVNVRRD